MDLVSQVDAKSQVGQGFDNLVDSAPALGRGVKLDDL